MIFKPAARYPADPRAVFILALSIFSGATALALDAGPQSLNSVLPTWAVTLWGVMLVLGSMTTLVGMTRQSFSGIVTEQIGSIIVAATTIFYAGIALKVIGPGALQSMGIILAWGLACIVRWGQLQVLIHSAIKRKQKREMLDRVFAEIEARELREVFERQKGRNHR